MASDAIEDSIAAARSERFELLARRKSGVCLVISAEQSRDAAMTMEVRWRR